MFTSPLCGLIVGFSFMSFLYVILRHWRPVTVGRVFGKLQLLSASYMGFAHGTNDAQKTMGIIALTLFAATKAGHIENLPAWLSFLRTPQDPGTVADELAANAERVGAKVDTIGPGGWDRVVVIGEEEMSSLAIVHKLAHEGHHHLLDIGRVLRTVRGR